MFTAHKPTFPGVLFISQLNNLQEAEKDIYKKWKQAGLVFTHCWLLFATARAVGTEEQQVTDPLQCIVLKHLEQGVIWNALGDCERPNLLIETLVVAFDRGVNWNALK